MISVTKLGTLGNNMWQYAVARTIAEKHNLQLNCYSIPGFPKTYDKVNGDTFNEPVYNIQGHYFDFNSIPKNSRIELKGYVQRYEYISSNKENVRQWFEMEVKSPIELSSNDLVVSIRRGWNGYPVSMCPSVEFFKSLFNNIEFNRIILCTDSFDDPFFDFMNNLNVEVIKAKYSALEQFALIKSANKIVLTPSTYCWWAAFLSNATEIYYPWIGDFIPTATGPNLFVYNESRYFIVKEK